MNDDWKACQQWLEQLCDGDSEDPRGEARAIVQAYRANGDEAEGRALHQS